MLEQLQRASAATTKLRRKSFKAKIDGSGVKFPMFPFPQFVQWGSVCRDSESQLPLFVCLFVCLFVANNAVISCDTWLSAVDLTGITCLFGHNGAEILP